MKTALLVVSFGTTHTDVLDSTLIPTERSIGEAFPHMMHFRAFTSRIVRQRLMGQYGIAVDDVPEALDRIRRSGCTHVLVQPTLLVAGEEYERLRSALSRFGEVLTISLGEPLLSSEQDAERLIRILREEYPVGYDTSLLLMGHGSHGGANGMYELLHRKMEQLPMDICTMDGTLSFEDGIRFMKETGNSQVLLVPLLFVAGVHAKHHMAGDSPDSLRSLLEREGFSVTQILRGLGEIPAVRAFYRDKAQAAYLRLQRAESCQGE